MIYVCFIAAIVLVVFVWKVSEVLTDMFDN